MLWVVECKVSSSGAKSLGFIGCLDVLVCIGFRRSGLGAGAILQRFFKGSVRVGHLRPGFIRLQGLEPEGLNARSGIGFEA